ncbi:MAG: Ppx/GppA phosphatase family protein [Caulobacteraceae bacterium]
MSALDADRRLCDAAVIDVGSNSVRLVFYRIEGRAVWTVYNEKILAGLGRDLASTSRLSPRGMATALSALRRFGALIEASRPRKVFAVATAAVREAIDGPEFSRRVAGETGIALRILTGEEEARYAALGVLDGAPASSGLVGDLGGASLELVRLTAGAPGKGVTLPLGPFAVRADGPFDAARVRRAATRYLDPIARDMSSETFNAVGGAWRNLALLHMRISNYPLEIVHQYEIERREALEAARFIAQQSRASLERMEGISRRRVEALPHAAVILETLIEGLNVQSVVLSAFGLREGLVFEDMAPDVRALDPLIEGCAALGGRAAMAEALGAALETWMAAAFARLPAVFGERDATLLAAACRLAEMGAQLHPDHRPELMFAAVLRAPIAGMNHPERVFIACAIFARHSGSTAAPSPALIERLLSPERRARARALGTAIRLGCDMSGRSPGLLAHARLEIRPNAVILEADEGWAATLLGEQTAKRAGALAGQLGRELRIRALPATATPPDRQTG